MSLGANECSAGPLPFVRAAHWSVRGLLCAPNQHTLWLDNPSSRNELLRNSEAAECAGAFQLVTQQPGRRWGRIGSQVFVSLPTVTVASLVVSLNVDWLAISRHTGGVGGGKRQARPDSISHCVLVVARNCGPSRKDEVSGRNSSS